MDKAGPWLHYWFCIFKIMPTKCHTQVNTAPTMHVGGPMFKLWPEENNRYPD